MVKTFGFSGSYNAWAGAIAWNIMSVMSAFYIGWHLGWMMAIYFMLAFGPFFWVIQCIAIINTSNVMVDGNGVRRCLGRRVVLSMQWSGIGSIQRVVKTLVPYNGGKKKDITYVKFFSITNGSSSLFNKKMVFSSNMSGFYEFMELVSQNAELHRLVIVDMPNQKH